jgi:hypothetical protein
MNETLLIFWQTALIVGFVLGEIWLIVLIVRSIRRRREDPVSPEVHQATHDARNETTALRGALRMLRKNEDVNLRNDNRHT